MNVDRLIYIIAAIFGLDYRICAPARDMEAEDALTRALARNGGDGLTACNPDAGACPKPCLRHRRVNVGIWPSWRCRKYRRWDFESENCRPCLPDLAPRLDCGTYQDHLETIERKERLVAFVKAHQQGAPIELRNMTGDEVPPQIEHLAAVFDLSENQAAQMFALARQARTISDNMGISPLWDREPSCPSWAQSGQERVWWDRNMGSLRSSGQPEIINPPNTTWYAHYPAPEVKAGGTLHSGVLWHARYSVNPISITVALPDEDRPAVSDYSPLLAAALPQQPSQDSSVSTSPPTPEQTQGHPTTLALPQSSPSHSS